MSYECKILLDSISETGKRITTFQITFPRIVLAEFNTHRMFSRNSASSRAIPFQSNLKRIIDDPFIPEKFPVNIKGMQPQEYYEINGKEYLAAKRIWLEALNQAKRCAGKLVGDFAGYYDGNVANYPIHLDIHKQIANRLLEPFSWHTVIVTATEFDNFFKLRCDENAQYEIRRIADLMYNLYHGRLDYEYHEYVDHHNLCLDCDKPESWHYEQQKLKVGEWHCPLVSEEDEKAINNLVNEELEGTAGEYDPKFWKLEFKKRISVARCARVSYLTHDGKRDIEKDLELFERLRTSGHWSPFEHVATPYYLEQEFVAATIKGLTKNGGGLSFVDWNRRSGNFIGWKQYRKEFQDENCTSFTKETK